MTPQYFAASSVYTDQLVPGKGALLQTFSTWHPNTNLNTQIQIKNLTPTLERRCNFSRQDWELFFLLSPSETRSRLSYDHSRVSRREGDYILLFSCFEARLRLLKIISRDRARKSEAYNHRWDFKIFEHVGDTCFRLLRQCLSARIRTSAAESGVTSVFNLWAQSCTWNWLFLDVLCPTQEETRPGCFCAKDCRDSVEMYTYTFTCTGGGGLYWAALDCTGMYLAVVGCSGLRCAVLGCTGLCWAVLGFTGLYHCWKKRKK